jgi:hypothetical protein
MQGRGRRREGGRENKKILVAWASINHFALDRRREREYKKNLKNRRGRGRERATENKKIPCCLGIH